MNREILGRLKKISERLKKNYNAEKVILFGSYARGEETEDSDVDLLVVMRNKVAPGQQVVEIRKALADLPIAKDIIVVSPEYFEHFRDVVGTVVWPALREGRVLYERRAA